MVDRSVVMKGQISARRVVLTSFFVDLLDIIINVGVALLTGSVVMISELFQAIADLISSTFLLVGIKRPLKEKVFWTILSVLMMVCFASTMSFYFGLQRFLHPEKIENIAIAYTALLIAVISNGYAFLISVKRITSGKKVKGILGIVRTFRASKMIMTKNTFVLDLMGASSALTGLIALVLYQLTGEIRFDGLGAMGIGIILGILSLDLLLNVKRNFNS